MNKSLLCKYLMVCLLTSLNTVSLAVTDGDEPLAPPSGYVAKKDGLRSFFDALSAKLNKPVVVSSKAGRKQISGEFNFDKPQLLLERIASELSLMWYYDGQSIYIYDTSEIKSTIISLQNVTLSRVDAFLKKTGLYDKRYPLRGDEMSTTFYVSGPPVLVDLIVNAARFMDHPSENGVAARQKIAVIRLNNVFVGDRTYTLRDQKVTVSGIETVITQLLGNDKQTPELQGKSTATEKPTTASMPPAMPDFSMANGVMGKKLSALTPPPSLADVVRREPVATDIKIVAYPDRNSLLVKGSPEQVQLVENLVSSLDIAKRHVELSLWIIDIQRNDLDQLGVNWKGGVSIANKFNVSLNGGSQSTLDGEKFIAAVLALSQQNKARVVSRPIVLTQENTPAIFDNNQTIYTKLLAERNVQLDHVTYGTMVSVLPRFSGDGQIEMSLNIEDGTTISEPDNEKPTDLPIVARTIISTVARVPKGKSLLIGGYTRDESRDAIAKIPGLGDIPLVGGLFRYRTQHGQNMVRVFMIQPRQIEEPLAPDASQFAQDVVNQTERDPLALTRDYLGQKNGS